MGKPLTRDLGSSSRCSRRGGSQRTHATSPCRRCSVAGHARRRRVGQPANMDAWLNPPPPFDRHTASFGLWHESHVVREARGDVVRRLGRLIPLHVAGGTLGSAALELPALMTGRARQRPMVGAQRNARRRRVIEVHRRPGGRTMAVLTLASQPRLVAIVLPANPAPIARGRRAGELPIRATRFRGPSGAGHLT